MLEYLNLRLQSSVAGESSLNVWQREGCLRYAYQTEETDAQPQAVIRVSGQTAEDFLMRLQQLHVYRWKERYSSKKGRVSLSGSRWLLLYKEEKGELRRFDGENAYPENWGSFFALMTELATETHAVHLNRLAGLTLSLRIERELAVWNPVRMQNERRRLRYQESLALDREKQSLRYVRSISKNTTVTHEYKITEIIDHLLGNCERYFQDFTKETRRFQERPGAVLTAKLRFRNGKRQSLSRSYDRYGVPDDWSEFLEDIHGTMAYYGLYGSFFDPALYRRGVKDGEYIYLSCVFEPDGKSYYYRTLDDSLEVGDLVIVPTGDRMEKERIVMVSGIEYFTRDQVPYPLEKTKLILRKAEFGRGQEERMGTDGRSDEETGGDAGEEDDSELF